MRFRYYLMIGVVALTAFGVGFVLVPSQREVALMHLRDKNYEAARQLYTRQLTKEDPPVSVVAPLTELYLQDSKVEAAVQLMEEYVRRHPGNIEARRRLGRLYQYANRPQDYLRNLEQLVRLQASESDLRELSDAYNFTAQYRKQLDVLKALVELQPAKARNHLDLAYLQASQGMLADAAATLKVMGLRCPGSRTEDTTEFLISLLLDSSEPDEAASVATRWIATHPDPKTVTRFASLLHFKKQPAAALRLVESLEYMTRRYPPLLVQFIELLIATGSSGKAFQRLKDLYQAGILPDDAVALFIDLLLQRGETALAVEVASERPLDLLPSWLLLSLADAGVTVGDKKFAAHMLEVVSAGWFRNNPVVAARLAFFVGDRPAAERWIRAARLETSLPAEQRISLADLLLRMGRRSEVHELLATVSGGGELPPSSIRDVARLYLEIDDPAAGLRLIDPLRDIRASRAIHESWALLAASTGKSEPVISWVKQQRAETLGEQFLSDLYFIAEAKESPALALASAEKLYRRRDGRRERLYLGRSLARTGKPVEALACLKSLVPGTKEEESAYLDALSAAAAANKQFASELHDYLVKELIDTGLSASEHEEVVRRLLELNEYQLVLPAVAELARRQGADWFSAYIDAARKAGRAPEMIGFLERELKREDLPSEAREERLYVLLESGADGIALPYLRTYAERKPEKWAGAYEESLQKLGRREELVAFWTARAQGQDVLPSEKRSIAYKALGAGEKELAESIFLTLAREAPPESQDVSMLLYIWGPRPGAAAVDWVITRAKNARDAELTLWMQHLMNVGAARQAAVLARNHLPPPGSGGALLDTYLAALVTTENFSELSSALECEIAADNDAGRLRRYARLALQAGLTASAGRAFERILVLADGDREALGWLGHLAFSDARYSLARSYLARYLALEAGDCESNFLYAEILRREKRPGEAQAYYHRALRQVDRSAKASFADRLVTAKLLMRTGRNAEALVEFERLLGQKPNDKNLRADLAAMLLDHGYLKQAGIMLQVSQEDKAVQRSSTTESKRQ